MSIALLASAGKGAAPKLYPEDVFSTYLYTGNGSTQTINNGIDLAGKGGMVWCKNRNTSSYAHQLNDTVRGASQVLSTNSTVANVNYSLASVSSFNSNGYSIGNNPDDNSNTNTFVSWTFRKAPKFFDIVTYTGNGVAGRQIPHNLGCEVGMIVVKCTSAVTGWNVYHRSLGATQAISLNSTNAAYINSTSWNDTTPTTTNFTVGTNTNTNANGQTYVAYLYAHDTSADGIIQCGSYVDTGSTGQSINLGWEPQYILYKGSNVVGSWFINDDMRGMSHSGGKSLVPNTANAEGTVSPFKPTATGVEMGNFVGTGNTVIYMAIRRPMKVPTSGTEVYNAIARTGTGAAATVTGVGFAPDLVIASSRGTTNGGFFDRLRGATKYLEKATTGAEGTGANSLTAFDMDGVTVGADTSTAFINYSGAYIDHFFKRAKGFFDIVCYTGTGVARTVNHNLGVVPELMIVKGRTAAGGFPTFWATYHATLGGTKALYLEQTAVPDTNINLWDNTNPTSSVFTVGGGLYTNWSTVPYVAYLFATLAGISKVGSYTGNGTSQTINCGFTTGARFILVKRTDSTGDWFIFDTVRGIVAGNDPHLSLNTTAAEVTTDDSIDPDASGFIVNQVAATNINVNLATYIYLAIA